MRHPRLVEFDSRLKQLFDDVDDALEDAYGNHYRLHPSRAKRGTTGNKEHDGLFNVGATFTPGYGSSLGRGYVVDVEMITLVHVPQDVREEIEQRAAELVAAKLPEYFPDRSLTVARDRNVFKITGDFNLGKL